MAGFDDANEGLFSRLMTGGETAVQSPAWACTCGCGAGGNDIGAYATRPSDDSYGYVAPAQAQALDTSTASLMAGSKWSGLDAATARTVVTYSFVEPATSVFAYADGDAAFAATATAFSAADRALTRELLARIEAVCNIEFVEVPDNAAECGVLRYGYSQQPNAMNYAGYAFFPSSSAIGGDIWIGANQATSQWDFYRPNLILHETLHAIGLKHPFAGNAVLPTSQDVIPNTVMSYSPVPGALTGYLQSYPAEPMAYDVAALQQLYGAAVNRSGDDSYNLAAGEFRGFRSIWDTDGIDTLDAGGLGCGVVLNLGAGAASDIGVRVSASATVAGAKVQTTYANTLTILGDVQIENAIGSNYADTLIGTSGANRLEGRGGNDVLQGGGGLDTAAYAGARANFVIAQSGAQASVRDATGAEGTDSLAQIERLVFADGRIALDLDGAAGIAARVLGAVFGADAVDNGDYVATALWLLDGGMSEEALVQLALDARLGTGATHAEVVDLLFSNLAGSLPGDAEAQPFIDMLQSGAATQASLAQTAAHMAINAANIDLVGLAANGLAYA